MKRLTFILIAVFIIAIDQAVKLFAVAGNALTVCNKGLAFGLGLGWATFNVFLVSLVVLVMFYWFFKVKDAYKMLALSLVLGGGISNLFDRFLGNGCVIDVFHLPFWPSFNVADVAISTGAFILLVIALRLNLK